MGPFLGRRPAGAPPVGRSKAAPLTREHESWPGDDRAAARFSAGEPDALELLVRHFADDLFVEAARLVGPDRGEEVVEETFLRALVDRDRYHGDPPLPEWLRTLLVASARGKGSPPSPAGGEETDHAPPFALTSRLVSRLEERARGGPAILRLRLLSRRTRLLALAGLAAAAVATYTFRRPEPVSSRTAPDTVAVFFDSSDVVKEAVTPPGKMAVVTLHGRLGEAPGWRLVGSPARERLPSALTSLFRLKVDREGKVVGVEKLFSVPSVPPAGIGKVLQELRFEPVPGVPQAATVEVRVVAE